MPGVLVAQLGPARNSPYIESFPVANNQTIYAGDWVVLADGGSGSPRVRKLTSGDIGLNYTESTVIKGVLGVALNDVITDSAGRAVAQMPIPDVHPQSQPVFNIPTTPAGFPSEPTTGAARMRVAIADNETIFAMRMRAASNGTVTFNQSFQGKSAGIQVFGINFAANTGSTGAAALLSIVGAIETDPNFNVLSTECWGLVRVKPAYQQIQLGVLWNA